MRKFVLLFIVINSICWVNAQNPEIKLDLPTIIPPSPTVAALMKFEEVPVNNYTGIPDISIPLFSSSTHCKDVNLDISLKYHPAAIAADERASDVGLGWSLFAGGTISRTVRGLPDEILDTGDNVRLGIYQNPNTYYSNKYYYLFDNLQNYNDGIYENIDLEEFDNIREFLWDSQVRGILDTEHDLWQFNFMGKTGRFYIKKNLSNGLLEVTPLDDYRLKVINNYDNISYKPLGFSVFDENGIKYTFDALESTTVNTLITSISSTTYESSLNIISSFNYPSSFHLSKIYDNQGNLIIDFTYNSSQMKETVIDNSTTYYEEDFKNNDISIRDFYLLNPCQSFVHGFTPYPIYNSISNQKDILTKKIQSINLIGLGKINFYYSINRLDSNISNASACYKLSEVNIQDFNNKQIKKIIFTQDYLTTKHTRMILKTISFQNFVDSNKENYSFTYKYVNNPYSSSEFINKDYWGYYNLTPFIDLGEFYRETNPEFCSNNILQKMTLPTGGSVVFDFEANTYSYIGDNQITNFDNNPNNFEQESNGVYFNTISNNDSNKQTLFSIQQNQEVFFKVDVQTTDNSGEYFVKIYKSETTSDTLVGGIHIENNYYDRLFSIKNLSPGTYKVSISSPNLGLTNFILCNVYSFYKIKNNNNFQYLFGGGNRIKKISYFNSNSSDPINSNLTPIREKIYQYNFFDNPNKSSGSLTYDIPKFIYQKSKKECPHCIGAPVFSTPISNINISWKDDDINPWIYNLTTTFNNLTPVKTQGADIGYQNVKILETNNGSSEYEYSSPITVPENITLENLSPPFLPTKNFDYKRGLLAKQRSYNTMNQLLTETVFTYNIIDYMETTGIKTYYTQFDFVNIYNDKYYNDYKNYITHCGQIGSSFLSCNSRNLTDHAGLPHDCDCFCYFGWPTEFTSYKFIKESYGWAKLNTKITKNYFYNNSSTPNIVTTTENFLYNSLNKELAEHSVTNSLGENLTTKYFYHNGNSPYSQNRISEIERIENYKNNTLLETKSINYTNNWSTNQSYLPQSILTSKGANNLENKLKYNSYDNYGNPLEVQQENGTIISYIWGYNQTQPIAKIENASYSQVSSYVNNLQTLSNGTNEASLLTALDALRSNLPNAMVTTYTYIPLVGVSTITDPKADRQTFTYDTFGRLQYVKDKNGNILSENQYHYRP